MLGIVQVIIIKKRRRRGSLPLLNRNYGRENKTINNKSNKKVNHT